MRWLLGLFLTVPAGGWCTGTIWAADSSSGTWLSEALAISLQGLTTFGEDRHGNLYLTNGGSLFRLDDPTALFYDGFESGDTSAW